MMTRRGVGSGWGICSINVPCNSVSVTTGASVTVETSCDWYPNVNQVQKKGEVVNKKVQNIYKNINIYVSCGGTRLSL